MPKLLLIEDNPRIQLANRDMLELLGYEVAIAMSLGEAREYLAAQMPDAIVLDIMLPDGSGLDFLRELRQTANIPVLMLTALGSADDTVAGLSTGADDYLAKPYEYKVLAARVEALLRRAGQVPGTLRKGTLTLEIVAGRALVDGKDMLLKPKEFSLLFIMAQNEKRPLSAEHLYEAVWKMPFAGDSQSMRTIVSRVRAKLTGTGYTITYLRNENRYVFQIDDENIIF